MSWFCKCGILNSGLNKSCVKKGSEHYQVSDNTPDFLMATVAGIGLEVKRTMTEQEEEYARFYRMGKILVKDMDMTELREYREELAKIAYQSRATLASADDELRERRAKEKKSDWLVTPKQSTTDAINAVEVRKARMTKIDRLREQLSSTIKDPAIVDEMIRGLERRATNKTVKTLTFPKSETETISIEIPKEKQEVKVFDASSLSFLKKDENNSN